ncbi:MAG: archaetidylserine decarboxylase [Myxococcota bacterium]
MSLFTLWCLSLLPTKLLSRCFGHLARWPAPRFLLRPVLRWYVSHFRVDVEEAEKPLSEYRTLTEFFTRRLRSGARVIDADPQVLVSPVDGRLGQYGQIEGDTLVQAKGHTYTLTELLGAQEYRQVFEGGSFATLYLSPRDYHRIHNPMDGAVESYSYFTGRLLPVNPPAVHNIPKLFARNERLVTYVRHESGAWVAVVKVGATNVGRIRLCYDDVVTNRWQDPNYRKDYQPAIPLKKGDELGIFEMGSTVILLFSKEIELRIPEGQDTFQLGQRLALFRSA